MDRGNYRGTTGGTSSAERARQLAEGPAPRRGAVPALPGTTAPDVATRNRRNKNRGADFERWVARRLGGRRTGPLGGKDDVIVGDTLAVQCKKVARGISLLKARLYLDALRITFPTRTPIVVWAEPGDNKNALVILSLADFEALYGVDAQTTDVIVSAHE